jgi:hypothetical protein
MTLSGVSPFLSGEGDVFIDSGSGVGLAVDIIHLNKDTVSNERKEGNGSSEQTEGKGSNERNADTGGNERNADTGSNERNADTGSNERNEHQLNNELYVAMTLSGVSPFLSGEGDVFIDSGSGVGLAVDIIHSGDVTRSGVSNWLAIGDNILSVSMLESTYSSLLS